MRYGILIGAILAAVAAYTWLWFDAAARVKAEITEWSEKQRARGMEVSYDAMTVDGYPYRLHVRLENPRLAREEDGTAWSWEGDALHAHALPYRLTHMIVAGEGRQRAMLRRPTKKGVVTESWDGTAVQAQASLVWTKGIFDRLAIDLQDLNGTRRTTFEPFDRSRPRAHEETLTADRIQLHSLRNWSGDTPDTEDITLPGGSHRLALRAQGIQWTDHRIKGLGDTISVLEAQLVLTGLPERLVRKRGFTHDETLRAWRENGGKAELHFATLNWDPVYVTATGSVGLDRKGRPKGRVDLRTDDTDGLIDALSDGGILKGDLDDIARAALGLIATLGGDEDGAMNVPVKLKGGKVYLSSIQVGKVPSLYDEAD